MVSISGCEKPDDQTDRLAEVEQTNTGLADKKTERQTVVKKTNNRHADRERAKRRKGRQHWSQDKQIYRQTGFRHAEKQASK